MVPRITDQQPRPLQLHRPHCDESLQGYRGHHELERHIADVHSRTRKGYICVDASADQQFLAKCKCCSGQKVYGAYYNAAAHLRRAHFHPRKRTRTRTDSSTEAPRDKTNTGNDPSMEVIKQHWIKEIEIEVTIAIPNSPGSTSPASTPQQELSNDNGHWNEPQSLSFVPPSTSETIEYDPFREWGNALNSQFGRPEILAIAPSVECAGARQLAFSTPEGPLSQSWDFDMMHPALVDLADDTSRRLDTEITPA